MSVAATLGVKALGVTETKYDPTMPALRLEINTEPLPEDHPVVHWPSLVIVYEKKNLLESGISNPDLLAMLEKREKIFNQEESDSEEEARKHNMSYDSDDSFIDDDVEDGDLKVRTKIGGFFVATGDTIASEKIEEPERPKKEKKKQKRKRDSDEDVTISPEVKTQLSKLRKKLNADSSTYTKDIIRQISKDTTAKNPLHLKLLPHILKIDFALFNEKAGTRNKIFEEICSLIPYTNKNHKNMTELVERFCETIIHKEDENRVNLTDLEKLKLEWYLKTTTKRRNETRKRTQRKIKKAIEKAKKDKTKMNSDNRPGYSDLRSDIYQIGLICNKYAKLRRLSGHKDTDDSSREDVFGKLIENFPKKCEVEMKIVKKLWESERRRAEGPRKKENRKRAANGTTSPRKKQKRKGPLRSKRYAPLPKNSWEDSQFTAS